MCMSFQFRDVTCKFSSPQTSILRLPTIQAVQIVAIFVNVKNAALLKLLKENNKI